MSAFHHHDVVDSPAGHSSAVVTSHHFSPGQLLGGVAGIVLAAIGLVTTIRTGVDSTLNTPVTEVFGITGSSYVGLFALLLGLLLLLSAASAAYRGVMGFLGALAIVAGVVLAAGNLRILLDVGAKQSTGWFGIVMGAIAVAGALMPTVVSSSRRVEDDRGNYDDRV